MRIVAHPEVGDWPTIDARDTGWSPALDAALVSCAGAPAIPAGALLVTTGQQPGLFGGPLYTVYKAVAAAAIARALSAQWSRPVVPLFWLAGDDHDYAEASTAAWLGATGVLERWHLTPRAPDAPQWPMSREVLSDDVAVGLAHLEAALPPGNARDQAMAWLRRWWCAGETLHSAYAGSLAELLAPLGIACIDPTCDVFKRAQVPILTTALRLSDELDAAVAAVPDAGTGITGGDGASLVFIETAVGRERLVRDGVGFRARRSGEHFTLTQLERLLASDPVRFSANVLLRPVVESALLPTVAYVAGPGELKYLTRQAGVLYPLLDVQPQVPVPRWGATVVEAWVDRLLARLGLTLDDVMSDDGRIGRDVLRRDMPPAVLPALKRLRDVIGESGHALGRAGQEIDSVLDRAIGGRIRRLELITDDLEKLLERHLRRRTGIAHAQYTRLGAALQPGGAPQERVVSVAAMYGRHGTSWLDAATASADAWASTRLETTPVAR